MNKCLLAFQQKQLQRNDKPYYMKPNFRQRRLSPIGESISSTPPEILSVPVITQESCSTHRSGSSSPSNDNSNLLSDKIRLEVEKERKQKLASLNNRKGRFIVLGSSGEHLPVTRNPGESNSSRFSSCESSEEDFHSAKTSLDEGK